MKKSLLYILAAMLTFSACDDPFMNTTFIAQDDEDENYTNAAYMSKYSEKYSLWIELLKYADLYNALNDATTNTTVFAPDNDAMNEFFQIRNIQSVKELDPEYARSVAEVHIINEVIREAQFVNYLPEGRVQIQTVFGTYLDIANGYVNNDIDDKYLNDITVQDEEAIYLNNMAKVTELCRVTKNGGVYTLGNVIRPLTETILEKLDTYNDNENSYKIFIEAAQRTGYDKIVKVYADTTYGISGNMIINDVKFTCFAVTDETYGKEGITTVESLAAYLGADGNYTNPENELYKYMSYHFINRNLSVNDLFATITDEDKTNIFDTRYKNQVITTKLVDGEKMLNDDIPFVRTGIMSRNGTIHKVGGVMPVFEPTPVTVIWDLCSFADIESIVNAYGADNNIGELFSNPISARDYKVNLVNEKYGAFSSIDYKANESKMSYNTWAQLGYYKCKWLEDGSAENQYGANNHDLLSLNLGYAGWIEMQTPTIIKGKYKVELYYAGMLSLANFYAEGSMVRFNIDDNQKMAYLWKGLERNSGFCITSETLFNGIEFETSDTHTFKATIMDILAKTNSRYVQLWDYIKFTPIIE